MHTPFQWCPSDVICCIARALLGKICTLMHAAACQAAPGLLAGFMACSRAPFVLLLLAATIYKVLAFQQSSFSARLLQSPETQSSPSGSARKPALALFLRRQALSEGAQGSHSWQLARHCPSTTSFPIIYSLFLPHSPAGLRPFHESTKPIGQKLPRLFALF